ncbi:MAG: hypothetical protein JRE64_10935 [Deltaproteobacteria bacterium]|nr:hypothetical protein [Deltaproteobacteria bacterium]
MGGRFGKYGDLKRKERLKRNKALDKSVLKKDPKESGKRKPKRIINGKQTTASYRKDKKTGKRTCRGNSKPGGDVFL